MFPYSSKELFFSLPVEFLPCFQSRKSASAYFVLFGFVMSLVLLRTVQEHLERPSARVLGARLRR